MSQLSSLKMKTGCFTPASISPFLILTMQVIPRKIIPCIRIRYIILILNLSGLDDGFVRLVLCFPYYANWIHLTWNFIITQINHIPLMLGCGGWDSNPRIPKEQGYRKHTMFSLRVLSKLRTPFIIRLKGTCAVDRAWRPRMNHLLCSFGSYIYLLLKLQDNHSLLSIRVDNMTQGQKLELKVSLYQIIHHGVG